MLVRNEQNEAQSIHLADLADDEIGSLAFLFGGVGDGRHAMATLIDAHNQYRSLSPEQQQRFRMHLTLNDISGQLLAKDALVLALAYEVGRLADDVKTALTTREPFIPGLVIEYITLGYVMPSFVHQQFVEYVKKWFTESSREVFVRTFPWLAISDESWEGILVKMEAWIDPETHYDPPLRSVKDTLAHYKPSIEDAPEDVMSGLASMGAGSGMMTQMQARLDEAKAQLKAQMLEVLKDRELSPDMINVTKHVLGDDATDEQIREFLANKVADNPQAVSGTGVLTSQEDELFFQLTHALSPQTGPVDEINEEVEAMYEAAGEGGLTKSHAVKAIKQYRKSTIWKTWVANPVQADPKHWFFLRGFKEPDEMNPVREYPQGKKILTCVHVNIEDFDTNSRLFLHERVLHERSSFFHVRAAA